MTNDAEALLFGPFGVLIEALLPNLDTNKQRAVDKKVAGGANTKNLRTAGTSITNRVAVLIRHIQRFWMAGCAWADKKIFALVNYVRRRPAIKSSRDSIFAKCTSCGKNVRADVVRVGQAGRCPVCGSTVSF